MGIYKLVACDTDSIKFCRKDGKPMDESEQNGILKKMNNAVPELINLEEDGYYDKFLVIKSKNYVTVNNEKTKYKGSSILDQKKEKILRSFLQKCITIILEFDGEKQHSELLNLYTKTCQEALNIKDIKQWCTKKTVTEAMLSCSTEAGRKAYDACQEAIKVGIIDGIQEQDKIWVYQYIKGQKQKVVKGEPQFYKKTGEPIMVDETALRFPQLFNGQYDKWHYVKRVHATLTILENIIDLKSFPKYHNAKERKLLESL